MDVQGITSGKFLISRKEATRLLISSSFPDNMNKKAQAGQVTLREIIIGFGFLEGLWLAVGINPEAEILKAFTEVLVDLGTGAGYVFLLKILPILIFIGTLALIYSLGGKLGLIAVGCAFLGGLLILVTPILSVILIIVALVIGSIAEGYP